jgi:protein-S-isoprenylcysteine O-methyltransferase Ste14
MIGFVLVVYWGRVLRMSRKAHRAARNSNFIPPEPLGRALRLIWAPIVLFWIAIPFLAATQGHRDRSIWLNSQWVLPPIRWVAVGVAILSLAGTWVCWKKLGRAWRMGINPGESTELVVTGPYAIVRHPIYALAMLLAAACVIAVPGLAMLLAVGGHALLLYAEAAREERYLTMQLGPAYARYCATVGRFIPRLKSALKARARRGEAD